MGCSSSQPGVEISLVLRDGDGQVIGGILCDTFLRCLYVDVLWVDEQYRGSGHGEALMTEAEQIARAHGCTFAHTTTFSYQAPDFYQHLGYRVFGVIEDYPDGIKQYFLKKPL
jgi:ribosomal protein S18 acetylase RimI-like enzyme